MQCASRKQKLVELCGIWRANIVVVSWIRAKERSPLLCVDESRHTLHTSSLLPGPPRLSQSGSRPDVSLQGPLGNRRQGLAVPGAATLPPSLHPATRNGSILDS